MSRNVGILSRKNKSVTVADIHRGDRRRSVIQTHLSAAQLLFQLEQRLLDGRRSVEVPNVQMADTHDLTCCRDIDVCGCI